MSKHQIPPEGGEQAGGREIGAVEPVSFVCISLTFDGPQRARLPIPPRSRLPNLFRLYVSRLRPMGLNVLGYQTHLVQRCHPCLRCCEERLNYQARTGLISSDQLTPSRIGNHSRRLMLAKSLLQVMSSSNSCSRPQDFQLFFDVFCDVHIIVTF